MVLDPCPARWDIEPIHPEAHLRWLRPAEISHILENYTRFHVSSPHIYPPSDGSLFLFNRKTLPHFRRDGHKWGKKEGHEKLKVYFHQIPPSHHFTFQALIRGFLKIFYVEGNEVLNCYYARGEDNRLLRRRVYWMLQQKFSHMVLVHYREVEGTASTSSRLGNDNDILVGWQDENIPYSRVYGDSTDTILYSSQALGHENGSHQGQSSTTMRDRSINPMDEDLPYQFQQSVGTQYWRSVYESTMTGQENGLIDNAASGVFGRIFEVVNRSGGSQGRQDSNSDSWPTSNWTVTL